MEIKVKNYNLADYMPKFLEGGVTPEAAPVEEPAAPEAQSQDQTQQVIAASQQALDTQDCNLAMQVLQVVIQMLGGGAPEQAAPGAQPVYKKGGKISRWIKN